MRIVLSLVISVFSLNLYADDAQQLSNLLRKLDTFKADFSQQMYIQSGEEPDLLTGTLIIQKPGKFRWQVTSPFEQLLIADGKSLWQYDVELEQVIARYIDESLGTTPVELLSGSVSDLNKKFNIKTSTVFLDTKKANEENAPIQNSDQKLSQVYYLTPLEDGQFESVTLIFQEDKLQSLILVDSLEQTTRVEFTNTQFGILIEPSQFIFTPPEGVDFVDSRTKSEIDTVLKDASEFEENATKSDQNND